MLEEKVNKALDLESRGRGRVSSFFSPPTFGVYKARIIQGQRLNLACSMYWTPLPRWTKHLKSWNNRLSVICLYPSSFFNQKQFCCCRFFNPLLTSTPLPLSRKKRERTAFLLLLVADWGQYWEVCLRWWKIDCTHRYVVLSPKLLMKQLALTLSFNRVFSFLWQPPTNPSLPELQAQA